MTLETDPAGPAPHSLIASDRVEGTQVRRNDGKKIGSIKRMMIDKHSGHVAYAVVSCGGFLGMGGEYRAVPWDRLKYDPSLGAYELGLSEEEFQRAPSSVSNEDVDWGERVPQYTGPADYRMPRHWG